MVFSCSAEAPVAVLLLPVVELERASAPIAVFSPAVVLFVSAPMPMAVLLLAVLLSPSASTPMAVLLLPVVFTLSAPPPMAVLPNPLVLLKRANTPLAVLANPVVLLKSALSPTALFSKPSVLLKRASTPLAVLLLPVVFLEAPLCQRLRFDYVTGTLVSNVEQESPGAESGVVAAVGIAPKRIPADGSVSDTGSDVEQGVCPSAVLNPGIASIWAGTTARNRGAIANQTTTKTTDDIDGITFLR